ncbi:MAG: DUF2304 domain-containing protein [Deltaproteobacteria bacterium]
MYPFQTIAIIGSLLLFVAIIDLVRRGLLKEKYSVLWLMSALVLLVLSIKKQILDTVAAYLGIAYPPSLLFLVAFLFVFLIVLHFSVVISVLHEKNKILAQELALLKDMMKDIPRDAFRREKDRQG